MQVTRLCSALVFEHPDRDRARLDAELARGGVGILQQPRLESGILPGACDQPGAIGRRAGVDRLDRPPQVGGREHALLDQKLADRLGQQLVVVKRLVLEVGLLGCDRCGSACGWS